MRAATIPQGLKPEGLWGVNVRAEARTLQLFSEHALPTKIHFEHEGD
jgi:hypothetical protein